MNDCTTETKFYVYEWKDGPGLYVFHKKQPDYLFPKDQYIEHTCLPMTDTINDYIYQLQHQKSLVDRENEQLREVVKHACGYNMEIYEKLLGRL